MLERSISQAVAPNPTPLGYGYENEMNCHSTHEPAVLHPMITPYPTAVDV
jgi:hypothetical protein